MKNQNEHSVSRTFTLWIKTLAYLLSILLIFYAVPANVYAELIDTVESALDNASEETIVEEVAEGIETEKAVFEVTDRREETVKHFRTEDGSFTAVQYGIPVHEKDENGEWQDIDNTLSESGSEYATPNARVKFAKKTTGNETLFTLHDGNRKITMSLSGVNKKVTGQVTNTQTEFSEDATQLQKLMTLDKLSSKILYPEILDGVDLEYVVNSGNIKENIIVKERSDAYSYTFEIKLNNLEAVLCEDGSVAISDPDTDEVVYTIPKGYMYDADGEYSDAVTYTLTNGRNGKYTLAVMADAEWVNTEERAFPVTVDPPINVTAGTVTATDTQIDSFNPIYPFFSLSTLSVGDIGDYRTYIAYWKLNTLPTLPDNVYITSAEFSLYCKSTSLNSTDAPVKLGVYRVTSAWEDTITWTTHTEDGEGTYGQLIDYADVNSSSKNNYVTWDITRLFKWWHSRAASNYGLAIAKIGDAQDSATFNSADASSNMPRLIVNYRDMKGVESYWSGSSHSAGLAGSGYVNHANGNLVFSIGSIGTGDALFGFTPALVYNSAIANQYNTYTYNTNVHYKYISSGYGLKLNTNESIVARSYTDENGEDQTFYIWADGDGTEHYFLYDAEAGAWKDEDGLGLSLTVNSAHYCIEDLNHNIRQFTNSSGTDYIYAGGVLEHIQDQYGNKLRFNYNSKGQTTSVDIVPADHSTTNAIHYLTLSYNSLGAIYRIQNVVTGQVMTFEYGTSFTDTASPSVTNAGPLRRVTYGHMSGSTLVSDEVMSYTYTNIAGIHVVATYRLASAKNETSGTELRYTYNSAGKVDSITEYGNNVKGQTIGYTYEANRTTLRGSGNDDVYGNSDDVFTYYTIDNRGRATSAYSTDLAHSIIYGSTTQTFNDQSEETQMPNRITSAAITNSASPNYIYNGNFEDESIGWTKNGYASVIYSDSYEKGYVAKLEGAGNGGGEISQFIILPAGIYTLSMKAQGNTTNQAKLKLTVSSVSSNTSTTQAFPLNAAFVNDNSELIEPSMTFEITEEQPYKISCQIVDADDSSIWAYVDDIMLEKSIGAGSYNGIYFGGFEETYASIAGGAQNMVSSAWCFNDATRISIDSDGLVDHSLKLQGNVNKKVQASQTVKLISDTLVEGYQNNIISFLSNDSQKRAFTISGFAKASNQVANPSATLRLSAAINYADGTQSETVEHFDFSKDVTSWQYVSGTFFSEQGKIVASIDVKCSYDYQNGTAYFDNISLVEETGSNVAEYEYNTNGLVTFEYSPGYSVYNKYDGTNRVLSADSNFQMASYEYDENNTLISQTTYEYMFYKEDITEDDPEEKNKRQPWLSPKCIDAESQIWVATPISKTDYTINTYGLNTKTVSYIAVTDDTAEKNTITGLYPVIQKPESMVIESTITYDTTAKSINFGKRTAVRDSTGNTIRFAYNSNGRLVYQYASDNTGLYFSYDELGRQSQIMPLAYDMTLGYFYNELNSENAEYIYNDKNQLFQVVTDTTTYEFVYDGFGNQTEIKAGGAPLATYTYAEGNGKLQSMTYGNGKVMSYIYDELDRVEKVCYTDSNGTQQSYNYTYTSDGAYHSIECTESGRTYYYTYDSQGRTTDYHEFANGKNSVSIHYAYDDRQRISDVDYTLYHTNGTETETYELLSSVFYNDATNQPEKYWLWTANSDDVLAIEYTYDEYYRPTIKTTTHGSFTQKEEYEYKNYTATKTTGRIEKYTSTVNGVSTEYTYVYDAKGNITRIYGSDNTDYIKYTYDNLGQLTREDNPFLGKTYVYTYDNAGNRLSKTTYAYTTLDNPGTATATQTYIYNNDSSWGDQLNGETYDAIGNPSYCNGFVLTWSGRQLMKMNMNMGQSVITFAYNADGIRTSKKNGTLEHIYTLDGSRIVSETIGNVLLVYLYDGSGAPIGLQYRTNSYEAGKFDTYYFEKNWQGDILAVYTDTGVKIGSYVYDAWGNCTVSTVSGNTTLQSQIVRTYNPFRYRGYYYDTETQLYYLQSRYYNPATGRFLNADGYVNANGDLIGFNMYAYCSNNPIAHIDSMGTTIEDITSNAMHCRNETGAFAFDKNTGEFLLWAYHNSIQLYSSEMEAAQAWAKKYRPLSKEREHTALILGYDLKFGSTVQRIYYLTDTYIGEADNVIAQVILLDWQKDSYLYTSMSMIHSHPNPEIGYHNDFPSTPFGDALAYYFYGYDELYVVPYKKCLSTPDIIIFSDKKTWCKRR